MAHNIHSYRALNCQSSTKDIEIGLLTNHVAVASFPGQICNSLGTRLVIMVWEPARVFAKHF